MTAGPTLTRRQLGLALGTAVAAACAPVPPRRELAERPPDRVIALPTADTQGRMRVEAALAARHSTRQFGNAAVSDGQIAQLLWAGQGVTRSWGGRTAPSAGALYPLDLYAVTTGLLWHYLPVGHRAEQWAVRADLRGELAAAAMNQAAVRSAPLVLVVVGTSSRTRGKYGARAGRYVALEAGHCAENVLLQATALSLAAVPVGAFSDEAVRHRLGLNSTRTPYYLIPVGPPA